MGWTSEQGRFFLLIPQSSVFGGGKALESDGCFSVFDGGGVVGGVSNTSSSGGIIPDLLW